MKNEYFTEEEIFEVMESVQDYSSCYFDDLFNSMFNNDYYIIGTYEASKALESYINTSSDYCRTALNGIFGAIELVQTYELDNYGEVLTNLTDPEQLANMVYYIRAESCFNDVLDYASLSMGDETSGENIKLFLNAVNELKNKKSC